MNVRSIHSHEATYVEPSTIDSIRGQILRLFEVVDGRAWEDLSQVFHSEAVYDRPGYPSLVGYSRVKRFYEHERIIQSGEHHLEQIVVTAPHAACWGTFVGTLKNGEPVEERFADAYWFDGTRIRHRRSFFFRPAV